MFVATFGLPGFEYRARKQKKRGPGRQPEKMRAAS
jgi:hypothetical protein